MNENSTNTAERYGQNRSNLLRVLSQFEELQYKE